MKAPGGQRRGGLDEIAGNASQKSAELLALDQALDELARVDARKARVIELRFFGGLSVEEAAEGLADFSAKCHARLETGPGMARPRVGLAADHLARLPTFKKDQR